MLLRQGAGGAGLQRGWRDHLGPTAAPLSLAGGPVLFLALVACLLQNLSHTSLPGSLSGFFPLVALGGCLSACKADIHFQIIYPAAPVGMCCIPSCMLDPEPGPQGVHNKCSLSRSVSGWRFGPEASPLLGLRLDVNWGLALISSAGDRRPGEEGG